MESLSADNYALLYLFLSLLLIYSPLILANFGGIMFSFSKLKDYPKTRRAAIAGLLILLIGNIIGIFLPIISKQIIVAFHGNTTSVSYILVIINLGVAMFATAGLLLLIYAVWSERK